MYALSRSRDRDALRVGVADAREWVAAGASRKYGRPQLGVGTEGTLMDDLRAPGLRPIRQENLEDETLTIVQPMVAKKFVI